MDKKLINKPEDVVSEMIGGFVAANDNKVKRLNDLNIVVRKNLNKNKVSLISGGGSGHEPAHAGFVGEGMLDVAISGDVFTSPTPDNIFKGIKAANNDKGSLLIVKNYSGDIMNFEMAAEMAEVEGIKTEMVVVNDDIAVEDSLYTTGRRGVAGTVFVHKIAGAKAEQGSNLDEVKVTAEKVIKNVRTKGVAINPCRIPSANETTFNLNDDEMEMGIGIHGEPGTERRKIKEVDFIVKELIDDLLKEFSFKNNDDLGLMINGMGGTPLMELYIANQTVHNYLNNKNLNIYKTYIGEFMTSLEMEGLSITILKLDDDMKELLDYETDINLLK